MRFLIGLALALLFLVLGGCLPHSTEESVEDNVLSGTVTYANEPVWEGNLVLQGADNSIGVASLQDDGSFTMADPPLGDVLVSVTNYPRVAVDKVQHNPPDLAGIAKCEVPPKISLLLPERFTDLSRSNLKVAVKPGQQRLTIRLPKRAGDPPYVPKPDSVVGPEVGNVAPEIRGTDLDGHAMSLREYRGKVVALVFWAHWCNLCREQFPHYHELVERTTDQPFALLGVNCDPDRDLFERENLSRGIIWRSWWDAVAVGGPVSRAWRLEGLPGVVLIDHEGIVRRRNLRGIDLDRAVDEMVRAVPSSVISP